MYDPNPVGITPPPEALALELPRYLLGRSYWWRCSGLSGRPSLEGKGGGNWAVCTVADALSYHHVPPTSPFMANVEDGTKSESAGSLHLTIQTSHRTPNRIEILASERRQGGT